MQYVACFDCKIKNFGKVVKCLRNILRICFFLCVSVAIWFVSCNFMRLLAEYLESVLRNAVELEYFDA